MLLHFVPRSDSQIPEIAALGELAADTHLSRCVSANASAQKLFPEADPLVFHSEQHRREVGLLKTQPGLISKPNIPFQLQKASISKIRINGSWMRVP